MSSKAAARSTTGLASLDTGHPVQRVEPAADPLAQRRELLLRHADRQGSLDGDVRVGQQLDGELGVAVDEVGAVNALLDGRHELDGLGDRLAGGGGARDCLGRTGRRQGRHGRADRDHAGHDPDPGEADATSTAGLALCGARNRARIRRAATRHEGEDPRQECREAPAQGGARPGDRVAGSVQPAADRIGERHRALVGDAGQGVRRANGLELASGGGRRDLRDLDGHHPVGSGPASDREQVLEVLDCLARPHGRQGALQLLDADGARQVTADQADAVAGGDAALPGERLDLERLAERGRHAPAPDAGILLGRGWRRRHLVHPAVAHDDRRGRAELRDVRLSAANDERDDADPGAPRDGEAAALVVEAPVRGSDGLGQRDEDARGQVVVVVGADRLERLAGRALQCRACRR